MYVVIALLLGLLGALGAVGFFILRELLLDAAAAQQKDAGDVQAELRSARLSIGSLRLEVAALTTEISGMKVRFEEHLNEALVPPMSLRGEALSAALADRGAKAPPVTGARTPPSP